jgi:hypothetical protein
MKKAQKHLNNKRKHESYEKTVENILLIEYLPVYA